MKENNWGERKSQAIKEVSRAWKKEEKQQAKIKKNLRNIFSRNSKKYSGREKKIYVAMEEILKKKERKN